MRHIVKCVYQNLLGRRVTVSDGKIGFRNDLN